MLRPADEATLQELGLAYEASSEGGFTCLQIHDFHVGAGLQPANARLLLRLPLGFPDTTPDMFWFDPPLRTAAGVAVPGTEVIEQHCARSWQRWSRHIQGQWRAGVDNLATYLAYVRRCLDLAAGRQ